MNDRSGKKPELAPDWQRVFCGFLAVGGLLTFGALLTELIREGRGAVAMIQGLSTSVPMIYVFGYIAVCGRLPRFMGGGK